MPRRTWGISDTVRLGELFDQALSDAEIAAAMKRTERAVANKRHDMNLRRYRRDTRLATTDTILGARFAIAMDALIEAELAARVAGAHDVVETIAVALRRIERCELTG